MSDEMMDIVNQKDEVIGTASQDEVYEKFYLHRIVHVMIFNDEGRFGIQLRSKNKSYKPSHWVTAVGGHPQAKESYEEAALREAREEIKANLTLTNFKKLDDYYDPERPKLKRFIGVFEAIYNGPFELNPEEVEDFQFKNKEELQNMLDSGELFHPELKFILSKVYGFKI